MPTNRKFRRGLGTWGWREKEGGGEERGEGRRGEEGEGVGVLWVGGKEEGEGVEEGEEGVILLQEGLVRRGEEGYLRGHSPFVQKSNNPIVLLGEGQCAALSCQNLLERLQTLLSHW